MLRVRYVHDTDTYMNVSDACCDTLHDTHYIIINPNYYKYVDLSIFLLYVWNQILSDTIRYDIWFVYMIQLTDTNTYISFYYVRNPNIQLWVKYIRVRVSLKPQFNFNTNTYLTCVNTDVIWIVLLHVIHKIRIHKNQIRFRYVLILFCNKTRPTRDFLSWYKLIHSCYYALLQILVTDTKETRYGYVLWGQGQGWWHVSCGCIACG